MTKRRGDAPPPPTGSATELLRRLDRLVSDYYCCGAHVALAGGCRGWPVAVVLWPMHQEDGRLNRMAGALARYEAQTVEAALAAAIADIEDKLRCRINRLTDALAGGDES